MNETFNDALIECVKACGGSKEVGFALWPTMGIEPAQRKLLACLNPDRHEKLGPDEVLTVLKMAREVGCHAGAQHIAQEAGYAAPVPVSRVDAAEEARAQFRRSVADLVKVAAVLQASGILTAADTKSLKVVS